MIEIYREVNWRYTFRRVLSETWEDDVFGRAAQLSYFLLFSLFPMLLILSVILGFLAQGTQLRSNLLEYFSSVMPARGFGLFRDSLEGITKNASGGKLWIGIITALWTGSSGMSSVIAALNKAYEIREARPWWKARMLAVLLTMGVAILVAAALALLLYGASLGRWVSGQVGFGNAFEVTWEIVRWPVALASAVLAFLLVYRFAPNVRQQKWRWLVPGAITAVTLWVLMSFGLRLYLHYFRSYGAVYGSLGAVLILLLWLYLSSAALLVGGELNSEIENAAAARGRADAKREGEKSPGSGAPKS